MTAVRTVALSALGMEGISTDSRLVVNDEQGRPVISQVLDDNGDGMADRLAILTSIPPGTSAQYSVIGKDTITRSSTQEPATYCRFVPERMDDFAWENDKVAFRVYGPACQQLFEQGDASGLISSGIDCWLKRVDYPIIDKWYAKPATGGSYHHDDGEGLDNFHVGKSRGSGGTAIRHNGQFIPSENYATWEILANGPLRSIFRLTYKPVIVEGKAVTETKTFTIDLGDNFFRCDVAFESELSLDTLAIGITLHDNQGTTNSSKEGWITYWEPIDDSEIGMAAWVVKDRMLGSEKFVNAGKDQDHIWLYAALKDNKCTYYSGFGWKKAGVFTDRQAWDAYVSSQQSATATPSKIAAR